MPTPPKTCLNCEGAPGSAAHPAKASDMPIAPSVAPRRIEFVRFTAGIMRARIHLFIPRWQNMGSPAARSGSWMSRRCGCLPVRNCEEKRRPVAGLRLDPDSPAVALDDFLAKRQADSRARVFIPRVQSLEDL